MTAARNCPPRFATVRNLDRSTFGPAVGKLARQFQLELMPWQQLVLDVALEHVDSQLCYREVRLTVPRQSGKTALLMAAMVFRCLMFEDNGRVAFTMQDGKSAREKLFDDYVPVLSKSSLGEFMQIRRSNGTEAITWPNGSMWKLMTTRETSGHGGTLDMGVIDEAFSQTDGRTEQAMKPAMVTRPNAQLWIVSTEGTNESIWFNDKIDQGRLLAESGLDSGVAYFEWSAPEDADPADEEVWWSCMPALGRTMSIETVRADYHSTELSEFKRAYLNIRQDKRVSAPWKVVAEADYNRCADPASSIVADSRLVFALEIPPSREMAAVAVAGHSGSGYPQIEIADHRGGTAWVLDRLVGIAERHGNHFEGVVIDKGAPAATFIEKLRAAGVNVLEVGGDSHARYAQGLLDDLRAGEVRHRDQEAFRSACEGAVKRGFGDRWLWNRRDGSVDISPLVAATLAHGALVHEPLPESKALTFAY